MEKLLPKFQAECEQSIKEQPREVVVGLDETFFGDFLILVLMDLRSGYLLLETIAEDRCYETWYEKTKPRLKELGIAVNHVISDRAKALVKMAVTGFECKSGADVFHAQQDVSRWLGARTGKRLSKAQKQMEKVQARESRIKDSTKKSRVITLKEQRIAGEIELKAAQEIQAEYHENLQGIAAEIHPFALTDNAVNDAKKVKARLELRAQAFENIAKTQALVDKRNVMAKFRNQFEPLAVSVDVWWLWVRETLQKLAVENTVLEQWLTETLLPVVYWQHKMQQTKQRCAKEKYQQAWEQASIVMKAHPFTATLSACEIEQWLAWAIHMAHQFQRSSSAVEGRNGCLSQMYHNGRGLSEKRLQSLTVIHNYGLKRTDGTTAATRLFDCNFPDLFTWLLNKMGQLPLARKSRERVVSNPLILAGVPS